MTKILASLRQRNNLEEMKLEKATHNEDSVQCLCLFSYSLFDSIHILAGLGKKVGRPVINNLMECTHKFFMSHSIQELISHLNY